MSHRSLLQFPWQEPSGTYDNSAMEDLWFNGRDDITLLSADSNLDGQDVDQFGDVNPSLDAHATFYFLPFEISGLAAGFDATPDLMQRDDGIAGLGAVGTSAQPSQHATTIPATDSGRTDSNSDPVPLAEMRMTSSESGNLELPAATVAGEHRAGPIDDHGSGLAAAADPHAVDASGAAATDSHGSSQVAAENATFIFHKNFGQVNIFDFTPGASAIQFDRDVFEDFADVQSHLIQVGADAAISRDYADFIIIHNFSIADFHAGDFVFV